MDCSHDYAKISELCAKGETYEQLSQLDMVIINIICVCKEQTDFENGRNFVDIQVVLLSLILVECFKNH